MNYDIEKLPKRVFSGAFKSGSHVQGIATDGEYMYYSFTTFLLKTDMAGNPVGSVDGLLGHLGCITYLNGCVYGSLEYKNDSVGKWILARLGRDVTLPDAFYLTRFETDKITRMGMSAERDGVMTAVKLTDVCEDFSAPGHRYGCSGIDGTAARGDELFVAYGVYGDTERDDNDDQVILRFSESAVIGAAAPLEVQTAAEAAELRAEEKIFIRTGNTTYGIQNLEYDPHRGRFIAAVYPGKKPQFDNPPMFFLDLDKKEVAGVSRFEYGSTGVIALGGGYYYFSEEGRDERGYFTNVVMYREDGDGFIKA